MQRTNPQGARTRSKIKKKFEQCPCYLGRTHIRCAHTPHCAVGWCGLGFLQGQALLQCYLFSEITRVVPVTGQL